MSLLSTYLPGSIALNVKATPHSDIVGQNVQAQLQELADKRAKDDTLIKFTLTDSTSPIVPDIKTYKAFNLTINGNRTLGYPTIVPNAGVMYIDVTVGALGNWLMSFAAGYRIVNNGGAWQSNANRINRIWLVVRTQVLIDVYLENIA